MKNTILVIGGMHGNETLGVDLVKILKKRPIAGIDVVIANPRAVRQNMRFTKSDMNRSFGGQFEDTYESKRAVWLEKRALDFALVLDFHNTQTPNNNCCFVGENCQTLLYQAAINLKLRQCVIADYDCINKVCPNTLSIEISSGDVFDNAVVWYNTLKAFSVDKKMGGTLNIYSFLKRVTWEEKDSLGLKDWQPFKPLDKKDKKLLGVGGIIVPIFVGSKLTEYWATLLRLERDKL